MRGTGPVWAVAWALVCAGAPVGTVPAATTGGDARRQIQGIFGRFDRAYEARDAKALRSLMERYMTPDFTRSVGGKPPISRSNLIKGVASVQQLTSVDDVSTRIQRLTLRGATAEVATRNAFAGTHKDSHGVTLKLTNASAYLYTFVKTPTGWKVRKMVELAHTFRVNDRVMEIYPPAPKK